MMKERTNTKSVAPRKVKGTVLFTVVCVMMVLIVFLMGALALAATANNRAMKNYNEAQTQATAKAGVRAMVSALKNDVSVASAIGSLTKGQKIELDKDKGVNDIQIGFYDGDTENRKMGEITNAKIEYVGNKVVLDENKLQEKAVICFSATAKQGQAESTVSVYMLRGVNGNAPSKIGGGGGGFVSAGSAQANNHTSMFGGTYVGFDELDNTKTPPVPKVKTDFAPGNDDIYEMPVQIYGNLKPVGRTSKFELVVPGPGTGMTVWGDIDFSGSGDAGSTINLVSANVSNSTMSGKNYTEIPYIFCDGAFKYPKGRLGSPDIPLNIFCNRFESFADAGLDIYADIYCYEATATSILGHQNQSTKLDKWVANIKEPGSTGDHSAGSFYTKGNLEIRGNVTIKGNLYVEGNLTINNGSLTVEGMATVKGTEGSSTTGNTPGTCSFPAHYEKSVITGNDPDKKIISTVEDVMKTNINPFGTNLITDVPVSDKAKCEANVFKITWDTAHDNIPVVTAEPGANTNAVKLGADNNLHIYDSCTLSGGLNKHAMIVEPPANTPIWIKLTGTKFDFEGDNAYIYVKDKNGGTANFLLATNVKIYKGTTKQQSIWTDSLDAAFAGADNKGIEIVTALGSSCGKAGVTQLGPIGVNIYSDKGDSSGNPRQLDMGDGANVFAANVMAPYLNLNHGPGAPSIYSLAENNKTEADKRFNVYYNGYELRQDGTYYGKNGDAVSKPFSPNVGIIGCCVINNLLSTNDWELLYVPQNGGGPGPSPSPVEEDALMQGWKTLYYENY